MDQARCISGKGYMDAYEHRQYSRSPSPTETPISPHLRQFPLPQKGPLLSLQYTNTPTLYPPRRRSSNSHHNASLLNDEPDVPPISPGNMSRSPSQLSIVSALSTQIPTALRDVRPAPAYVAAFGTAQVLGESSRAKNAASDDESVRSASTGDAQFSEPALALANSFLDQLLYSFLSNAQSTNLGALRPAVTEVLKTRLARDAIASADAELHELLAGGEDEEEEMNARQSNAEARRGWDLELIWKRTRLRVMVYTRLGEIEDDDEERYVREEKLFHGDERRFSQSTGLVSWAAAIFLTTVLEHISEQVILVAAQIARHRLRHSMNGNLSPDSSTLSGESEGIIVEDYDMEKIALNSKLGRLWRTWRKSLHDLKDGTPLTLDDTTLRDAGAESNTLNHSPDQDSFGTAHEDGVDAESIAPGQEEVTVLGGDALAEHQIPEVDHPEHVLAANIPLPMTDDKRDIDEIEIPGLARDPDEENSDGFRTPEEHFIKHRRSASDFKRAQQKKPVLQRQRSRSVPMLRDAAEQERKKSVVELPSMNDAVAIVAAFAAERRLDTNVMGQEEAHSVKTTTPKDSAVLNEGESGGLEGELAKAQETTSTTKDEVPSLVAGAVAGASALAAAAAAAVFGTAHKNITEDQLGAKHAATPTSEVLQPTEETYDHSEKTVLEAANGHASASVLSATDMQEHEQTAAAVTDEPQDEEQVSEITAARVVELTSATKPTIVSTPEANSAKSTPVQSHKDLAKTDIEDMDLQKYRTMDMLEFAHRATDKPVKQTEAVESAKLAETPIVAPGTVETYRPAARRLSTASEQSFSLLPKEQSLRPQPAPVPTIRTLITEPVDAEEGNDDDVDFIGMARTSDTAVATPRIDEHVDDQTLMKYTSTANPRRFSRLILGDDLPSPVAPSHDSGTEEGTGTDHFPVRSVSPVQEQGDKHKPDEFQQKATNRLSAPNSVAQPQTAEKSWRQSLSATLDKNKRTGQSTDSASDPPVQDHPVISRMASIKNTSKSPTKPVAPEEKPAPLTSASIRGPEDFDMFVQGGDTVKYTLTPENVRDGNASPTERRTLPRTSRDESREQSLAKLQSVVPESRIVKSQSSRHVTPVTDIAEDQSGRSTAGSVASRADHRQSIGRPPTRNTSIHRKSGFFAREPQVQTDSTRDFADFIRSTGPDKEAKVYAAKENNRSSISLSSIRNSLLGRSRSKSQSAATRNPLKDDNVPPVPAVPASRRKSAAADVGTAPKTADRRKSWTRSFSGQRNSVVTTASNYGVTNVHAVVHPAHSGQQQSFAEPLPANAAYVASKGKSVRNKDPYALDMGDDDDFTALPSARRNDESMIDFLRSTNPPENGKLPNGAGTSASTTALPVLSALPTRTTSGAPNLDFANSQHYNTSQMEPRPPSSKHNRSDTRELADFLRDSGPPATAAAVAAMNSTSENRTATLPPGVARNKSTPQAPLSRDSKSSRPIKSSNSAAAPGTDGKRKWWAIFTSKGRNARDAARREGQASY